MKKSIIRSSVKIVAACLVGSALLSVGGAASAATTTSASTASCATWNASQIYILGQCATYQGIVYTAKWWTQGNVPGTEQWGPWQAAGTTSGTTSTTTVTTTSTTLATSSKCVPYVAGTAYSAGQVVSNAGGYYSCTVAGWCSQGISAYEPGVGWAYTSAWSAVSASTCGATSNTTTTTTAKATTTTTTAKATTTTTTATVTSTTNAIPAPTGLVFSAYKDITVNMNWNTNVISSKVTGTLLPVLSAMPAKLNTLTWAFATGECGNENWGGVAPSAIAAANVQNAVNAGKRYILSTGGAAGSFTCGTDAGFDTFIKTYYSANLLGIDFDIEAGQTQSVINNLVQRVIVAQRNYPSLRFSFTLATLGGNASQSLGSAGVMVLNAIKAYGLKNYTINLMVMDYGSNLASNCVLGTNGLCDMGKSATQAAINLRNAYAIPYSQIALTPMIGGNDATDEVFTLEDVATVSSFVLQNGLAGVHFWSFDRDNDCAPGYASPTCNTYGKAGMLGFTNRFLLNLGK